MTTPRSRRKSTRAVLPVPSLRTLAERYAIGKTLREKVPRSRHAGWTPPSRRRNPIDILIESSAGRIPSLLPIRYGRMLQSPFAFYRGAAAIMAADLATTPKTGVRLQVCGDCHLMNFGGFATPERRIIFDINDFDETLPAPWEWDVKRLSASFVAAARSNRFTKREARAAATAAVRSYREHVASIAEMPTMQAWYVSVSGLAEAVGNPRLRKRYDKLVREERVHGSAHEFAELAHYVDGAARIKDDPPLVFHADIERDPAFWRRVHRELRRYRESLPDDRRVLFDRFQLCDMAAKVVGVGSVGTACAVALFLAAKEDPLFLQFKEAHSSVLEPFAGKSVYANHGERVVIGQRLMQAASDIFLGWTTGEEARHFYVRQLRDIKIKPLVEIMEPPDLVSYAQACGWALARAHARSGDAAVLAGYMGKGGAFDDAIADFAVAYADQNERDHQELVKAVRAGRIKVKTGT